MTRATACQTRVDWASQAELEPFRTLVIGDIDRWTAGGRETLSFANFQFSTFEGLSTDMLRDFAPKMVLSPLMGDNFDVLDVATHLRRLGYKGCYRAISQHLPNAGLIRAEIAEVAPELDFDLLLMPAS